MKNLVKNRSIRALLPKFMPVVVSIPIKGCRTLCQHWLDYGLTPQLWLAG